MPSPFPGMDPYLERAEFWQDFHQSFLPRARDLLVGQVQPRYAIRVEAHLYIHEPVERSAYLEIRDRRSRELVTVVELLSPANKYAGPDRDAYLQKRWHLLAGRVNLVEVDLLRGGPRLPIPDLPACDYYAFVCRVDDWPDAGLWPLRLADRLPTIPVPLRAGDADARLDLQAVLDAVYDAAQYATDGLYDEEPTPRLTPEQAAWARGLIAA